MKIQAKLQMRIEESIREQFGEIASERGWTEGELLAHVMQPAVFVRREYPLGNRNPVDRGEGEPPVQ